MTEPAPDPRLRARRVALCVLVWSFFGILGGLSFAFDLVTPRYLMVGVSRLPWPTERFLDMARALRTLPVMAVSALTAIVATSLILRGACDRNLKPLTISFIVGIPLFMTVFALSLYLPFLRISSH